MAEDKANIAAVGNNAGEVPFSFDEIFFSKTDQRGIILSGNAVFQRISQYSWDELMKKPHNIIRHPDMPRGVFYLLWDFLKKNKPIAAYVKNRAKDGRHYWVFAIVTPVDGGYLSVRIKPSSEFFPIVENAYKALLAYEKENKVTPQESMVYLQGVIQSLGFDSYDYFMSVAIRKELNSRSRNLGLSPEIFLQKFEDITSRTTALTQEMTSILKAYESNRYVPMNLQIQSAQLGEEGKTIGVISGNFSVVSNEMQEEINLFNKSAGEVFKKIYDGQFLLCIARVQQETVELFKRESTGDDNNQDSLEQANLLSKQLAEYRHKAIDSLSEIVRIINVFQEDCRRMKRCAASLEVIRVMGKVDAARLTSAPSGLNELIDELGVFQISITRSLSLIEGHNNTMRYDTESVLSYIQQ